MDIEQWKQISNFDYEVSSLGRVRGPNLNIIKPWKKGKYLAVSLYISGKKFDFKVHTLVMKTFVGKRPDGSDIHHINEDSHDNRLCNLGYVSRSANMLAISKRSRFTIKDIQKIKFMRGNMSGKSLSKIFKCSEATITKIIQGKYDYLLDAVQQSQKGGD